METKTSAWSSDDILVILRNKGIKPLSIQPVLSKKLKDLRDKEDYFNVSFRIPCWMIVSESGVQYWRMDNAEQLSEVPNSVSIVFPDQGVLESCKDGLTYMFLKKDGNKLYWEQSKEHKNRYWVSMVLPGTSIAS